MEDGGCKAVFTAVQSGQGSHMTDGAQLSNYALIRLRETILLSVEKPIYPH